MTPSRPSTSISTRVADRLEDIQWLLDSGESIDEVARRVGVGSPKTLARWLDRHGQRDLVKVFSSAA